METPTEVIEPAATRPPEGAGRQQERVVVGLDGSVGFRLALAWTLTAAARRGAAVQAVSVFPIETYLACRTALPAPGADDESVPQAAVKARGQGSTGVFAAEARRQSERPTELGGLAYGLVSTWSG